MRYLVHAKSGRKVNAIGKRYPIACVVDADDTEAALLAAYQIIDHLFGVTVVPLAEANIQEPFELVGPLPR